MGLSECTLFARVIRAGLRATDGPSGGGGMVGWNPTKMRFMLAQKFNTDVSSDYSAKIIDEIKRHLDG